MRDMGPPKLITAHDRRIEILTARRFDRARVLQSQERIADRSCSESVVADLSWGTCLDEPVDDNY